MGAFRDSVPKFFVPPQFLLCQERFVLNIYHNKNKNLVPLTVYFALQTWLQACFMPGYTFTLSAFWQFWLLSLQMLMISLHISFLQLVAIESVNSQLVWFIKF